MHAVFSKVTVKQRKEKYLLSILIDGQTENLELSRLKEEKIKACVNRVDNRNP